MPSITVKPIPKDPEAQKKYERNIVKPIYARLIDLRKSAGYNQEDIAAFLGMSLTGYASIEQGKVIMNIPKLIKLTEIYATTLNYLVYGDEKSNLVDEQLLKNKDAEIASYKKQNKILERQVELLEEKLNRKK